MHSRKYAGFVNDKAVGILPIEGGKGGITLITKKTKFTQKPSSAIYTTVFGGNKTSRRTYKGVVNTVVKSRYRSDLRAEAVARASAIRYSQKPKGDLPKKKLRGSKAKKAAVKNKD